MKIAKAVSYGQFQKKYSGEYIARRENRVLAHAKTYPLLKKRILQKKLDRKSVIIGFVPPKDMICIYASSISFRQ